MADRELRLRIGASIDASFNTVFATVAGTVKRVRQQIEREMKSGAVVGATAHKEAGKEIVKATISNAEQMKRWEKDITRNVGQQAKERIKINREGLREVERDLRTHVRAQQEAQKILNRDLAPRNPTGGGRGNGGRGGRSFLQGFGLSLAYRAGSAAISFPGRVAGDALRGLGVDTDMATLLQGGVARQSTAQKIANSAYIPQGGPTGSNVLRSNAAINAQATETGIKTGLATQDVLEGMQKFVGMTGDIETIENSMTSIGMIAKANGAEFGDMAQAAAEVANAMGDIPNKGKAITDVMRVIAGQGQLTAIEIKDMAKYLGMITSQANFFKIDSGSAKTLKGAGVESEAGQRIAVVSGLAQFARQRGGRVTARMAMQSSMAMIRDMASPTEVKRMQERGLSPYADAGHTTLRDPVQMILESFKQAQTKGGVNRDVLNRLFPNQQSRAVVNAFSQSYNDEYRKAVEKGITSETERHQFALKEVNEEFQRMLRVTQSDEQVQKAFARAMSTAESKATVFKNQLGKVGDQLTIALIPALLSLSPLLLDFAKGLGSFVETLTGDHQTDPMVQMTEDRAEAVLENTRAKIANKSATPEDEHRMAQTMIDLNKAIEVRRGELGGMRLNAGELQGGTRKLFHKGEKFSGMDENKLQSLARQDDMAGKEARQYLELRNQLQKMETTSRELNMELLGKLQTAVSNGLRSGGPIPVVVAPMGVDPGGGTSNPDASVGP